MKVTCGTDIIEIERIKESIENLGAKFLERVLKIRWKLIATKELDIRKVFQ